MSLITWNEHLSVGIERFDLEHREMIAVINDLDAAMQRGEGAQALGDLLRRLVDYTRRHFRSEEETLEAHGYPDLDAHRREHRSLEEQVLDLQDAYEGGRRSLSVQTMTFLRDWLKNHIMGCDHRYGPFLRGSDTII
jgi:hemerythrin-like metal-binding protein